MGHFRWNLPPPAPPTHPAYVMGFSPLMVQLLANRGLSQSDQIDAFLKEGSPTVSDPFLLTDMSVAVARIAKALAAGETIAVYGDFDVDGITSTALMVQTLSALGAKVVPYIPHRMKEGYGLRTPALTNLHQQGVSLVISVDCGISAAKEVREARQLGLDIIITDHHAMPLEMPSALAVINPKRADSKYPFSDLAGVGVALKLRQALLLSFGQPPQPDGVSDLVALGTIADMVPLLGENRSLVKVGLKQINAGPRLGISEMMAQARLKPGGVDAEYVSWVLAPRLNAAGRLDHALNGYKLLLTQSTEEAKELVIWLEGKNSTRQEMTSRFSNMAKEQVQTKGVASLVLVSGAEYPIGIAGLVASRLAETYYRPAIVVESGEKSSRGSCRSIPEFNIVRALDQCHELLGQYGGHAQAAGFTLPTENLILLEQKLVQLAMEQLAGADLRPRLEIDAVVNLPHVGGNAYQMMQMFAPFGMGNREPLFLSRNVEVVNCSVMGRDGTHLKLKLKQGKTTWDAVGFGLGSCLNEAVSQVDVVYNLAVDHWNGQERLRLNIVDFAPSTAKSSLI